MAESVQQLLMETAPTREGVVRLLGPPDYDESSGFVFYVLGCWSGGFDVDCLNILFGPDDTVAQVGISR